MKAVTIAGGLFCLIAATPLWAQNDPSRAAASYDELFKRLDRNGDGKLTRDEIPRLFDQLDTNKDGVVTPEEARAYRPGAPVSPAPRPSKPAPSADTLKRTLDIRYANTPGVEAKAQSLDVYAPKDAKDAPVMIYVHGGYWRVGDKGAVDAGPDFFCGAGYLFVSINYRLTPAGQHPANIQDVAKAVAWVHDHIAEHGGNPAQMFLMGHSAGGHLVALLGTDAKRLGEAGKPLSVLRGVIPLDAAAYDLREVTANDRSPDSPFRGAFGDDPAAWADASPIVHVGNGRTVPPFQLVVADGPVLAKKRQGADGFAAALRRAGAHAEIVDTSGFRDHQTLSREFGKRDDAVSKAVLQFCESVRGGKGLAGPGGERVLRSESKSAAEAASELATRRANAVVKALDKNRDGKITRDELPEQYRRMFEQLDKNKDGVLTADEAGFLVQRRAQATEKPSAPEADVAPAGATSAQMKPTLDIRYANTPGVDAKSQSLDVYAPADAKNAPVLIFIHGGGWRKGDKSSPYVGSIPAAHFNKHGFVFVSINYRLAPAGKHPANIQDVAKAVAWVHDYIAEHGGDPAQINIMGHSAGAHLTALIATDESRLKAESKPLSILNRAILLDTAAYDIPRFLKEFGEGREGTGMRQLYTNAFGDTEAQWRDASPQSHVAPGKNIPPMLMFFTSSRMAANALAPALAAALTQAGSPSRAVDTITLEHNEIGQKSADKDHPLGQLVLRFLKGEDVTKFPARLDLQQVVKPRMTDRTSGGERKPAPEPTIKD